jgi:hypothetical protein
MNFTERVAAAKAASAQRASAQQASAQQASALNVQRMSEFNLALSAIADELQALPATVQLGEISSSVELKQGNHTVKVEVYFNAEIWNMYLMVCQDSTTEAFETFHKEATPRQAIERIAELIGAFQAKWA